MQEIEITVHTYSPFLQDIEAQINEAKVRAARVVNQELTQLYWKIGERIVIAQKEHGWGKSIVERLSRDLLKIFPGVSGFSARNLWNMRQFYLEYANAPKLQPLAAVIPWSQNIEILSRVKEEDARIYYLTAVAEMGWTKEVLIHQIKTEAYERHRTSKKQHNFVKALPAHLAEQADLAMKDEYILDFLGIKKPILEMELERRMVNKIKEVMLELGYGFSFIGNQYSIKANNTEYLIDLLFYNRRLKSLVALEIKAGHFKPEYAGKMNFYLNLLDDFVREPGENPSVGIILCSERDRFEVEYALRGIDKPVGVSQFQLTKELPKELQDKLPNAENLEKELMKELYLLQDENKTEE
jgi:predicted nuclease of restriction endonuclease-like (RecB) superfamily